MGRHIEQHVIRGEIDNRIRGRITGRLWIAGRAEPVVLDLAGNAQRDLAGRRLEFHNPFPRPWTAGQVLAAVESGPVGHCTASLRRVFWGTIRPGQWRRMLARTGRQPWDRVNCLFLSYFSPTSGQVTVLATDFRLTIDPESTWDMSQAEEDREKQGNAERAQAFVRSLPREDLERLAYLEIDANLQAKRARPAPAPPSAETPPADVPPLTEEEAQRMVEETEYLNRCVWQRVKQEDIDDEDAWEQEKAKLRSERGPLSPLEAAKRARCLEHLYYTDEGRKLDPGELRSKHPLADRAFDLRDRWGDDAGESAWLPPPASDQDEDPAEYSRHTIVALLNQFADACADISLGLWDARWPKPPACCARAIFHLRRACGHLERAQRTADTAREQGLAAAWWLGDVQREMHELHRECERFIGELRARLAGGLG
jgi:hypothetical protein